MPLTTPALSAVSATSVAFAGATTPTIGFIRVDNTLAALQRWASYHRQNHAPQQVVAITGSNGKTVVKEWFAQLWSSPDTLFRSPKSFNSQLGVALSLLMTTGDEKTAIIEAGISQPGEMERLQRMIAPQIGLITNIGEAHQENFGSLSEKLAEKLLLFKSCETVIFHADGGAFEDQISAQFSDKQLFRWGESPTADLRLVSSSVEGDFREVNIAYRPWQPIRSTVSTLPACGTSLNASTETSSAQPPQIVQRTFRLPFTDKASLENSLNVIALMLVLGVEIPYAEMTDLQPVAMRLELKHGINNCKVVNDSYNSDINSLAIALDYLHTLAGNQSKVLIVSDIMQSGMTPQRLYARVSELVTLKGIDLVIGVGETISQYAHLFQGERQFFRSTNDFLTHFRRETLRNKAILVKGSRHFQFERISKALERKIHTTALEVNLDAMIHNLNYFREQLSPGVKTMAMVKAASYGHGTHEIAALLQHQRVDYLAVAFADEGVALREHDILTPIVVLNPDPVGFDTMIEHALEPEIYSFSSLHSFLRVAKRHSENGYPIHIKLDTGMHRLGFDTADLEALCALLKNEKSVRVASVFSHLAASDMPDHDDFTRDQIAQFDAMSSRIVAAVPSLPNQKIVRHICNSAGIERFPEAHFDMVRLGIGLYGVSDFHAADLQPVSTLKSIVVQVKRVSAAQTVGYARRGVLQRDATIAVIPIGYADGLDRRLSNGGWSVLVGGQLAPIVGNICMDTCMIDVTGMDVKEGDSVTLFGESLAVTAMAERLGTIAYEIFTSISTRVNRIFLKE